MVFLPVVNCSLFLLQDLLELAENIGPARPQGLTKATLDRLPVHMWERSNEEQKYSYIHVHTGI